MKDRELLQLFFAEGKQNQAFRLLLNRYSEKLYWPIRRIVLSHDDADDVLQNTFIKIFKNLHSFEGKSSLYSWMYKIALNEALSFLKRKKRDADIDSLEFAENLVSDPYFDGDESYQKLLLAVRQLPEKQQLVFHLKYFDQLKYDEIAEILGGTVGSLKASYHHAVKKIEFFLLAD